ncbi:MAG TPA: FoF1 ATP synthase subunit gamma [Pirellulaceae bacterium]|nr:F0F1 ATP synthase subunit gamma [Planctomycetales bacterium]HRX82370.1 FoF1 ATP synthase subunit gamma [Pirellulaceae bacterium]
MKRLQYLRHRLQTLSALRDAVGAMRSLSAHHFRRARQALPTARQYREEMNTVIAEIGIHQPLHVGIPAGLLVITSDLGLCGDYNSRLSQLAVAESKSQAAQTIYSVGHRARAALAKSSLVPFRSYEAPASLEGLTQLLLGLAQDLLEDYLAMRIGRLHVVSAGFEGVGHFAPLSVCVLPIEPVVGTSPLRRSPYIDSAHLTTTAVREFLYITLYEILLDALAAEHGMRLMAAESALEWLDNTATTTSRRLASARGEASTQELLDIVSGGRQRLRR